MLCLGSAAGGYAVVLVAIGERMNTRTRRRALWESTSSRLVPALHALLSAGFVEHDGCVFLAARSHPLPPDGPLDATGREAFVNHVHIDDQLAQGGRRDVARQGWLYAHALVGELGRVFPEAAFEVVLAIGDSATVRFYRRRAHEPPWISADLESYEREAVLVLDVG